MSLFPDAGVPLLIEPFAGSAAVSVAARHYERAGNIYLSDVNGPLIELWRMIIDSPEVLLDEYARMWHAQQEGSDPLAAAKQYYMRKRAEFNENKNPAILLYLLARCVKAAVRYSKNGDFNQAADNRRLGARPAITRTRVLHTSRLLRNAEVVVHSYEDQLINAPRDALVYMDPPYQGTSDVPDHRYLTGLQRNAFADTLQQAIDNEVSFIVSYDAIREDRKYGEALPAELGLTHRHVAVGVSTQATLSGRREMTVESLYLSPALVARLGDEDTIDRRFAVPA